MQCNCRKVYIANHSRTTDQNGLILRQIYIVKNSKLFCTLTIAFAKFTHKVTKYILEQKMESVSQNLLRFSTKIANCYIKDITKNRKSISFISIRKKRRRPRLRKELLSGVRDVITFTMGPVPCMYRQYAPNVWPAIYHSNGTFL